MRKTMRILGLFKKAVPRRCCIRFWRPIAQTKAHGLFYAAGKNPSWKFVSPSFLALKRFLNWKNPMPRRNIRIKFWNSHNFGSLCMYIKWYPWSFWMSYRPPKSNSALRRYGQNKLGRLNWITLYCFGQFYFIFSNWMESRIEGRI